jgi:hypothetical protein
VLAVAITKLKERHDYVGTYRQDCGVGCRKDAQVVDGVRGSEAGGCVGPVAGHQQQADRKSGRLGCK